MEHGLIVNITQAANESGLSTWEIYTGIRSGKYPAIKVGMGRGKWMVNMELFMKRVDELMLQNISPPLSDSPPMVISIRGDDP